MHMTHGAIFRRCWLQNLNIRYAKCQIRMYICTYLTFSILYIQILQPVTTYDSMDVESSLDTTQVLTKGKEDDNDMSHNDMDGPPLLKVFKLFLIQN